MTRVQYLLTKLAEECNETGQRACKAAVFGINDVQPGVDKGDNASRLIEEFSHIVAYMQLLENEGYIPDTIDWDEVDKKKKELEQWYQFSIEKGQVK